MVYLGITASVHNDDNTTRDALRNFEADKSTDHAALPASPFISLYLQSQDKEAELEHDEPPTAAQFIDRRMFPLQASSNKEPRVWSESNGEAKAVIDIMSALMQDALQDEDFTTLVEDATRNETPVYYYQMPNAFRSTKAAASSEGGAGAAVEDDEGSSASPEDPSASSSTAEGADGAAEQAEAPAGAGGEPSDGADGTQDEPGGEVALDSRADPDFLALAEECFEAIFAGLIDSASKQEIDLTARSRLILN